MHMKKNCSFEQLNKVSLLGFAAAMVFACSPFLYLNLFGRGLFLYLIVIFVIASLICAMNTYSGILKIYMGSSEKIFLIMVIWQVFTYLWSPALSFDHIYSYFKVIIFFILLSFSYYTDKDKNLMVWALIGISLFSIIYVLNAGVVYDSAGVDGDRVTFNFFGVKQDPNYLCFMFIVPFVYLISVVFNKKNKKFLRIVSGVFLLVIAYGVLNTGSRGGLLAIFIGALVYLMFYQKRKWKTLISLCLLAVVVITLFENLDKFLPENIVNRFSLETIIETGGSKRTTLWENYLLDVIKDPAYFLIGRGNGAGSVIFGYASHNYWIDTLYNYGLIGLGITGYFWLNMLIIAKRNENWIALGSICGIAVLATTLSVGTIMQFWLAMSMVNIINKKTGEVS